MTKYESDLSNILDDIENEENSYKFLLTFMLVLAVKNFHELDLMHFDIKPQNFLIKNKYLAVLSDFGFVQKKD